MRSEREGLTYTLDVPASAEGTRLDKFLAEALPELSRTQIQRLIDADQVELPRGKATARYRVQSGERISLEVPPPKPTHLSPEAIPLDIVFEDDALVVVNKPPGMVVHPAPGHDHGTLVNALLHHCKSLSGIGGEERPGIVHRLDKDTSGLLLVAKHDRSHRHLSEQLRDRTLSRHYLALVQGRPPTEQGTIDAPIGRHPQHRQKMAVVEAHGRAARTHYQVRESWGALSLLQLSLETGRTHQIRVHLAHIGRPIIGDPVYGTNVVSLPRYPALERWLRAFPRQVLHARELQFTHPETGETMTFSALLPDDLATLMTRIRQALGG
jgi:23S rRNA pseudouridine1911/1915/1917 synthase